eukprot:753682-Hanusia_phi.AAC.3
MDRDRTMPPAGTSWIRSAIKISFAALLVSVALFVTLSAGPKDVSLLSSLQAHDRLDASAEVLHNWLLKRAFAGHKEERDIHKHGLDVIATKILKSLVARKKMKALARTSVLVSNEPSFRGHVPQSNLYSRGASSGLVASHSFVKALFGHQAEDEQRDRMLHRLRMLEKAVEYVKEDQRPDVKRYLRSYISFPLIFKPKEMDSNRQLQEGSQGVFSKIYFKKHRILTNCAQAINEQEEAVRRKEDSFENFESFDRKLGFGVDNVVNHYHRYSRTPSLDSPMNSTSGDAVDFLSNSAESGGSKIVITVQGGEDQSSNTPEIVIGVKRKPGPSKWTASVLSLDESCPCLDTFTYKSSIYSGCIATDGWDRPWCATENCGTCGNTMISSNCWKFCGSFDESPRKTSDPKASIDEEKSVEKEESPTSPNQPEKQSPAEDVGSDLSPAGCKRDAGKFFCKTDMLCVISCEGCTDLSRESTTSDGNVCSPSSQHRDEAPIAVQESRQQDEVAKEGREESQGSPREEKQGNSGKGEVTPPIKSNGPAILCPLSALKLLFVFCRITSAREGAAESKGREAGTGAGEAEAGGKEGTTAEGAGKSEWGGSQRTVRQQENPDDVQPKEAEQASPKRGEQSAGGGDQGAEPRQGHDDRSGTGERQEVARPLTYSSMLPLQRAAWHLQEEARHLSTEQEALRDDQQKARRQLTTCKGSKRTSFRRGRSFLAERWTEVERRKEGRGRGEERRGGEEKRDRSLLLPAGSIGNGWTLTVLSFGIAVLALLIMVRTPPPSTSIFRFFVLILSFASRGCGRNPCPQQVYQCDYRQVDASPSSCLLALPPAARSNSQISCSCACCLLSWTSTRLIPSWTHLESP